MSTAAALTALALGAAPVRAAGDKPGSLTLRPGDVHEISLTRDMEMRSNQGSSGSSHDRWTIMERVVAVGQAGVELEYDLPPDAPMQSRSSQWQYPVRVLRPARGPMQLLDRPVVEARVEAWLKAHKLTRASCGQWGFTWTAFQIECDPQSAIQMLAALDLKTADLREGATYEDAGAQAPAPLLKGTVDRTLVAELAVDGDVVRREKARADVVVGQFMKTPVTFEVALSKRADEFISGTITVTFEIDAKGDATRRTKVVRLEVRGPGESVETQTTTEVVARRLTLRGGS